MTDALPSLFHHVRLWLALPFYLAATPLVWIGARLDPDAPSASWKELLP